MRTVQLIVECTMDEGREALIEKIGRVKYRLPIINSYVVEVPESAVHLLNGIDGIKTVHQNAHITAQMDQARRIVSTTEIHTGNGVGIAILDTGVAPVDDLTLPENRIIAFKDMVNGRNDAYDDNGHGTHVSGVAAGNGRRSRGRYRGIAPEANIIGIKILDGSGRGNSADVLAGIQWMVDMREKLNIRVANLSIGTASNGLNDPLIKAVEKAWDAGIVMVIAAGNNGPAEGSVTSPGISKKVLTVGSSDDHKQVRIWGDAVENYSGRGPTAECVIKPDILAPGADIVSCLAPGCTPGKDGEARIVSRYYMQMSGTSMSTPFVTGAAAVLLQKNPGLTPNEVKLAMKKSCVSLNHPPNKQGWGLLNVERLLEIGGGRING